MKNTDRRELTRGKLMSAARTLFVQKGYADTSTPEIVRLANVTRGALYHHFQDKTDLFRAVVIAEAGSLATAIDTAAQENLTETMDAGSQAFFAAMQVPGRVRLLLLDGPAVLGHDEMAQIDAGGGRASLHTGLQAMRPQLDPQILDALSDVLSAAYDRAALAIAQGADAAPYQAAMAQLVNGKTV